MCVPEALPVGPPAVTATILPSFATTEPCSITLPVPSMIRALVITTFWAGALRATPIATHPARIPSFIRIIPPGADLLRASWIPGGQHRHGQYGGGLGGRFTRLGDRVKCFLARSTERQADHRIRRWNEAEWRTLLGEDIDASLFAVRGHIDASRRIDRGTIATAVEFAEFALPG